MNRLVLMLCMALAAVAADPIIVAHRGGMAERPENTFSAFDNAISIGVGMIEFDLGVTSDDALIVHHDSSVNPQICTTASAKPGPIRTLTLAQIKSFDCGSKQAARYPKQKTVPGERMPTLSEVLERYKSAKVRYLVETKMEEENSPGFVAPGHFVKLIVEQIRDYKVQDRFILQSGDYRTIEEMRRLEPKVKVCLLNARRFKPKYMDLWEKYKPDYFMLRHDDVTDDQLASLRARKVKIISSTANTEADWKEYRRRGFDGILTDEPSAVKAFLTTPK